MADTGWYHNIESRTIGRSDSSFPGTDNANWFYVQSDSEVTYWVQMQSARVASPKAKANANGKLTGGLPASASSGNAVTVASVNVASSSVTSSNTAGLPSLTGNVPSSSARGEDLSKLRCRNCKVLGHKAERCPKVRCNYCKLFGHMKTICMEKSRKCNLYGQAEHIWAFCGYKNPFTCSLCNAEVHSTTDCPDPVRTSRR